MDGYEEAVKRFYAVFRPLQKKYNLRSHIHFSLWSDGTIEIYEYDGAGRKKRICKVEESSDIACYNRAEEWLKLYKEQKEKGA